MSDWRMQPGYGGGFERRPLAPPPSSQEAAFSGDPAFLEGPAVQAGDLPTPMAPMSGVEPVLQVAGGHEGSGSCPHSPHPLMAWNHLLCNCHQVRVPKSDFESHHSPTLRPSMAPLLAT